jgi:hypothetical protein
VRIIRTSAAVVARTLRADGKVVTETYPISNAREESAKRNRFLIEPEELMRGERYAREHDLEVVGFIIRIRIHRPCRRNTISSTRGPLTRTSSFDERGRASGSFSWEQEPDRSKFNPEEIRVIRG